MYNTIINIHTFLFARRRFHRLNRLLFNLGMHGLGVLNYKNSKVSGESRFLADYLKGKKDLIVFDVGANIGNYSKEIVSNNSRVKIYAFEPHPTTFKKLVSRFNQSPMVTVFNCALSNQPGQLLLYDYSSHDGSSHASLFRDVIEEMRQSESISHRVDVITLDAFIEENGIAQIDLLKIDTEGNEFDILKGAVEAISEGKVKAIHFEFNEMNVISRAFFRDFWDLLPGYAFYRMLPDGLLPIEQYSALTCEIFAYQNIVAILKEEPIAP
jgi:FkbM family methyltransferase